MSFQARTRAWRRGAVLRKFAAPLEDQRSPAAVPEPFEREVWRVTPQAVVNAESHVRASKVLRCAGVPIMRLPRAEACDLLVHCVMDRVGADPPDGLALAREVALYCPAAWKTGQAKTLFDGPSNRLPILDPSSTTASPSDVSM